MHFDLKQATHFGCPHVVKHCERCQVANGYLLLAAIDEVTCSDGCAVTDPLDCLAGLILDFQVHRWSQQGSVSMVHLDFWFPQSSCGCRQISQDSDFALFPETGSSVHCHYRWIQSDSEHRSSTENTHLLLQDNYHFLQVCRSSDSCLSLERRSEFDGHHPRYSRLCCDDRLAGNDFRLTWQTHRLGCVSHRSMANPCLRYMQGCPDPPGESHGCPSEKQYRHLLLFHHQTTKENKVRKIVHKNRTIFESFTLCINIRIAHRRPH